MVVTDENNVQTTNNYRYDANGNMTCRIEGGQTFLQTFNAENRMSGVALVSGDCDTQGDTLKTWIFTYDGDGTKVKQVNTEGTSTLTTYYYAGGSYEVQTDGTTEMVRQYYSIAGMTFAMKVGAYGDTPAEWVFFLTDHLGSVVGVTDASGALISETRYLPFGDVRLSVGLISQTDFGYTFQRNLPEMGLMDYKARFYDSYLNQWTQPDTIIPDPNNPQSWNRYSYVNRNPIKYSDPTGHMLWQGDGGGYAGELEENLAKDNQLKCLTGDNKYCSYVYNHPVETVVSFVAALIGAAAIPEIGAGLDAIDLIGWKILGACLRNPTCVRVIGAGSASAFPNKIGNDTFVRFDPSNVAKSINETGIQTKYFPDGKIWLTKYKYIKDIGNPADLETILYRQNLWDQMAGKFSSGAMLRAVNVEEAIHVGVSNVINGVPQWYVTSNISPDLLQIIRVIQGN